MWCLWIVACSGEAPTSGVAPAKPAAAVVAPVVVPATQGPFGYGPHVVATGRATPDPVPVTGPNVPGGTCPTGMVPVPARAPRYCIDAYEVHVAPGGVATSAAGVVPSAGFSFDAAREACARTPVGEGGAHGMKRLALATEWEDAADGVVGPGGRKWPMGNVPSGDACATLDLTGRQIHPKALLTGAMPRCVSAFGVFDQLGNLWEWMDSGLRVDRAGWVAARAEEGLTVSVAADDRLLITPHDPKRLDLLMNDVDRGSLRVDEAGALYIVPSPRRAEAQAPVRAGFLITMNHVPAAGTDLLPVEIAPLTTGLRSGPWAVYLRGADDGTAIPDKRGCAHYVGMPGNCGPSMRNYGHTRDFAGSIGFRCVADPIPAG